MWRLKGEDMWLGQRKVRIMGRGRRLNGTPVLAPIRKSQAMFQAAIRSVGTAFACDGQHPEEALNSHALCFGGACRELGPEVSGAQAQAALTLRHSWRRSASTDLELPESRKQAGAGACQALRQPHPRGHPMMATAVLLVHQEQTGRGN